MSDPRTGEVAAKYILVFNELGKLKTGGFAHMLDSADEWEMNALEAAVDTLIAQINRTKTALGIP